MKWTCKHCGMMREENIWDRLPSRTKEVGELLMEGCNYKTIAEKMKVHLGTVKSHVSYMLRLVNIDTKIYDGRIKLVRLLWDEKLLWNKSPNIEGVADHLSGSGRTEKSGNSEPTAHHRELHQEQHTGHIR